MNYIESKLQAAGALGKVIPSEDDLVPQARAIFREQVDDLVDHLISILLPLEAMKHSAFASLVPDLSMARGRIEEAFKRDPSISWEKAFQQKFSALASAQKEEVADLMREHITEKTTSGRYHPR